MRIRFSFVLDTSTNIFAKFRLIENSSLARYAWEKFINGAGSLEEFQMFFYIHKSSLGMLSLDAFEEIHLLCSNSNSSKHHFRMVPFWFHRCMGSDD